MTEYHASASPAGALAPPDGPVRAGPAGSSAGPVRLGLYGLFVLFVMGLVHAILDGPLVDVILAGEINQLTGGLLVLSTLMAVWLPRLTGRFTPSQCLWLFFLVFALLGPPGARIFLKTFGLYHGRYDILSAYPLFVWSLGVAAFMAGLLVAHGLVPIRVRTVIRWDKTRSRWAFWLVFAIAAACTAYVLAKIGYLPVLKGNIGAERGLYDRVAGEYVLKFSRLWFIAAPLAAMFFYLGRAPRLQAVLAAVSVLALMVYGQRVYAVVGLLSIALIHAKFRPIPARWLVGGLVLVVAFILLAEWRGGALRQKIPTQDILVMNSAREWREYAIVVNNLRSSERFYGEKLFIGALAPLLPKQIWDIFGVDKEHLVHKYGANFIFGAEFRDPIGIRVGTIGEAYAGYGLYWGVCLQLFFFGLLFGVLEKAYLGLHPADARLVFVSFLMALLLILPINTLYITTSYLSFFGCFHLLAYLIGRSWRPTPLTGAGLAGPARPAGPGGPGGPAGPGGPSRADPRQPADPRQAAAMRQGAARA